MVGTLCAVIPMFGLLAELALGLMSDLVTMFPNGCWAIAAMLAVGTNLALWCGLGRKLPKWLAVLVYGAVFGMAALYAVVELPMLLLILFTIPMGFGVLGAAPYWVLLGAPFLLRELRARHGLSKRSLVALLAAASLPFVVAVLDRMTREDVDADLVRIADHVNDRGDEHAEVEQLSARLRRQPLDFQRRFGWSRAHRRWVPGPGGHLSTGEPFWFVSPGRREAGRHLARQVLHRVHGREVWNEGSSGPRGRATLEWRESTVHVDVDTRAAIAAVDWQLEVASTNHGNEEARFEFLLPTRAVASGLSLWIDGEERPAAFAAASQVSEAYERVVWRNRDPALLREIAPGRLELRLFPLSKFGDPMRVRVSFTVPMTPVDDGATLRLPCVDAHDCRGESIARHRLTFAVDGGDAQSEWCDVGHLGDSRRWSLSAQPPPTVWTRDAGGVVTQSWGPGRRAADAFVVVFEACASVGDNVSDPAQLLSVLPEQSRCVVMVAHGWGSRRVDGRVGDARFEEELRALSLEGGCDASLAVQRAFEAARELGVDRVFWLHGAMPRGTGVAPRGRRAVPPDIRLIALALAPGHHELLHGTPAFGSAAEAVHPARYDLAAMRDALADAVTAPVATRQITRTDAAPDGATRCSDQFARLWAGHEAASLARTDLAAGAGLAARYRLVAAGAGAVVLETAQQYDQHGLDPGALIGHEPSGDIGSQPVPEPSTFVLLSTGLLVLIWWRFRQRRRAAT